MSSGAQVSSICFTLIGIVYDLTAATLAVFQYCSQERKESTKDKRVYGRVTPFYRSFQEDPQSITGTM